MWCKVATADVVVRTTEFYAEGWNPIKIYDRYTRGNTGDDFRILIPSNDNTRYFHRAIHRYDMAGSSAGSNRQVTVSEYTGQRFVRGWNARVLINKLAIPFNSTGAHVGNAKLSNTRSFVSAGMTVFTPIKTETAKANTIYIKRTVIAGQFQVVLEVSTALDVIITTTDLYGLRISPDKRRIEGIVGFTEEKLVLLGLANGDKINLTIKPTQVERLI